MSLLIVAVRLFGLSRIVVNDSITLVTFHNSLRSDRVAKTETLIEFACQRLRAVLLTSLLCETSL